MKVCLVRGALVSPRGSVNNEPTPPIGLAYIAASLKAAGCSVQGIDATGQALNRVDEIPGARLYLPRPARIWRTICNIAWAEPQQYRHRAANPRPPATHACHVRNAPLAL